MNFYTIVGRIVEMKNIDTETMQLVISVNRQFKSENGEYEIDLIKVIAKDKFKNSINEYAKIEDIIAVKGRIETDNILIAEKISLLSSKKDNE